ncbi:MAG: amino acid transporter [Saprospiraceae bacterium]|nr:MAG: amino acid transporter [Saprospiraceae bacterium]
MPQLQKKLTLYGLTMIAVGGCIGSGIFVTPADIVQAVPHHGLVLLVWGLGGLIAMTGALTFAELGGMFPHSGGVYVYLREAYGEWVGFLYGWVTLLVINTGALAALGIALSEYLTFFIPMDQTMKIFVAIGVIGGLTGINIFGVQISQLFANTFTGLKLLAILAIIVAGFIFYEPANVQLNLSLAKGVPENLFSAILVGLIGVLWSFGGWHHASYLAGETKDAQRTVPRAMVLGALIVTLTYVLVNLAYMMLLPLEEIAGTTRVAGDAIATLLPYGGKLVAIAIAISIFGTIGIYTMSAPRIYFAMAKDGIFFKSLAFIHPRYRTPVNAMLVQAIWAIILLLFWGTFSNLITYVTFMDIVFMTLAGFSVFVFRIKLPEKNRPYRTFGYPVIPLIFVLVSGAFVINTVIHRPVQALAGLFLLGLGLCVYFGFRKKG